MDNFFASVEVRERPELKGLPVVIGTDPKGGAGWGVLLSVNISVRFLFQREAMQSKVTQSH